MNRHPQAIARRRRELIQATDRIAADNSAMFVTDDVPNEYKTEVETWKLRLGEQVTSIVNIVDTLDETVGTMLYEHIRSAIALACILEIQSEQFTFRADYMKWLRDSASAKTLPANEAKRRDGKTMNEVITRHAADNRRPAGRRNATDDNVAKQIACQVNIDLETAGLSPLTAGAIAGRLRKIRREQTPKQNPTDEQV